MWITEQLLWQKAEHNEGRLVDLEELALHELEIERIEHFDMLCRHIRILLLQNNLIPKMENLSKLKELEYINLTLNNIEKIEGLKGCDSLKKLDLTCNFIVAENLLESTKNLRKCPSIEEVYLMGNPLCDFENYKQIVIAICPNIIIIDGEKVTPSQRILSSENLKSNLEELQRFIDKENNRLKNMSDEERGKQFNKEQRIKMYEENKEKEEEENKEKEEQKPKISSIYNSLGELRICNEGQLSFELEEYDHEEITNFKLEIPRSVETKEIDIKIFKEHVSVRVKEKLTEIELWEEVFENPLKVQRSMVSGELLIELRKKRKVFVERKEEKNDEEKSQEEISSDEQLPDLVE